jgi:hypothetical protein
MQTDEGEKLKFKKKEQEQEKKKKNIPLNNDMFVLRVEIAGKLSGTLNDTKIYGSSTVDCLSIFTIFNKKRSRGRHAG